MGISQFSCPFVIFVFQNHRRQGTLPSADQGHNRQVDTLLAELYVQTEKKSLNTLKGASVLSGLSVSQWFNGRAENEKGKVREQKALFEQLKSPHRHERWAAARQLSELEEEPTAQALAYLVLEAPHLSLSRTAAEQLAKLDARCAKACLLQDAVYKIPHWAANEQLPKALAGSLGYHQGSAETLVDNVVIALEGALDPAIVWAAARALLRRKDELTRRLTIRLLGGLRVPQAIPSLRRIARAEEGLLRSEAVHALDQIVNQPLPSRKL